MVGLKTTDMLFNDYRKHNFSLGANTQLANGLKISASFNYIESQSNKPPLFYYFMGF